MIRVFLADDHAMLRAGMRQLLALERDIVVTGEASDGRIVLEAMERLDWAVDVLVLDLSMPGIGGLEVIRRARARHPSLAVLVLSMYAEEQYARRAIEAGAAGYLSKDRSEEELFTAIRAVAGGSLHVRRDLIGLPGAKEGASAPQHERLSPREHQIFTLIVEGKAVTEVAAELNLSTSTVSTHLAKIKSKLGVRSVAEIVGYAHRAGLVD